jgi:hypothetical protein
VFGTKKKTKIQIEPQPRGFYAFNIERAGDALIFVEQQHMCYKFLYIPGGDPFYLSTEDFSKSIKRGILSFIEQLPEEIYEESLSLSCPSKESKIGTNEKTKV